MFEATRHEANTEGMMGHGYQVRLRRDVAGTIMGEEDGMLNPLPSWCEGATREGEEDPPNISAKRSVL